MATFDDRERGFESKFARDQEIEFKAVARRNRLVGVWAGERMGLAEQHLEDYAKAVVRSDFEHPGEDDVVRKVMQDFKAAGLHATEAEVRTKMAELLAVAREQIRTA